MEIKDRLKQLRIEKGWTQIEMSEKLGMTHSAYGHYERGVNIPPSDKLSEMSKLFNVSVEYLRCETDFRNYVEEFSTKFNEKRLRSEVHILDAVAELYGEDVCHTLSIIVKLNPNGIKKVQNYCEDILEVYSRKGN